WQERKQFATLFNIIPAFNTTLKKIKNVGSIENMLQYYANNKSGMKAYQLKDLGISKYFSLPQLKQELLLPLSQDLDIHELIFNYDMHYSLSNHHVIRDDLSAMHHHVEMRY